MPRFRAKPVIVEATRLSVPMTINAGIIEFARGNIGDWLVTGINEEQYFIDDATFQMTFEPVEEPVEDNT